MKNKVKKFYEKNNLYQEYVSRGNLPLLRVEDLIEKAMEDENKRCTRKLKIKINEIWKEHQEYNYKTIEVLDKLKEFVLEKKDD